MSSLGESVEEETNDSSLAFALMRVSSLRRSGWDSDFVSGLEIMCLVDGDLTACRFFARKLVFRFFCLGMDAFELAAIFSVKLSIHPNRK